MKGFLARKTDRVAPAGSLADVAKFSLLNLFTLELGNGSLSRLAVLIVLALSLASIQVARCFIRTWPIGRVERYELSEESFFFKFEQASADLAAQYFGSSLAAFRLRLQLSTCAPWCHARTQLSHRRGTQVANAVRISRLASCD